MMQPKYLYHGTRYPNAILHSDILRMAEHGDQHLSLTSSYDVALKWARAKRDDDEGRGAVMTFLFADLVQFDPQPYVSQVWAGCEAECEFAIHDHLDPVEKYLQWIVYV